MDHNAASSKSEAELALGLVNVIGSLVGHPEEKRLIVIGEAIILIAQQNSGLAAKLLRFGQFFSADFRVEPEEDREDDPLDLERLLDFSEKECASMASTALSFIEKVGQLRKLPEKEKRPQFFFLLSRVMMIYPGLGDKLLEMAGTFSDEYLLETHNPPSLCPQTGIHIQLGEASEFVHTPLEEVLRRLALAPTTGLGGVMRDISDPVDYGNEMRVGPDDMVLQIGGQTSPEAFGKDSYPKDFPPGVSEHCRYTIFSAGGSRLINAHEEIVLKLKKEK